MAPSVQQKSQVFFPGQKTVSNRGVLLQPLDYLAQHGYKGVLENIIASAFEELHIRKTPRGVNFEKPTTKFLINPEKRSVYLLLSDQYISGNVQGRIMHKMYR